jgi:3-hydroxyacyl-CoA dehydrogenase
MKSIQKVCVIGAGVMGASIAAHIANAGTPVLLMDIVPDIVPQRVPDKSGKNESPQLSRNIIAKTAIKHLLKAKPAPFTSPQKAKYITPLNIEDDLERIQECDWIIEAIVENVNAKQSLYRKINKLRKTDSIVSSNTSTIVLSTLIDGLSDDFKQAFCITHFFNPPRYMTLLELITSSQTNTANIETLEQFCDLKLGKSIIHCLDSPGFIANRLGVFWLYTALTETIDSGLTIEQADALLSKPCGVPKTGVFALLDMIGLELMPKVIESLLSALPEDDPFVQIKRDLPFLQDMIAKGYIGRKGKGGFYRLKSSNGKKVKEALNLATFKYAKAKKVSVTASSFNINNIKQLFELKDEFSEFVWRVMSKTLAYAAYLIPFASQNIKDIDEAMRLGYNWRLGPFELIDKIGVDYFIERLEHSASEIPQQLNRARGKSFYSIENNKRHYLTDVGCAQPIIKLPGTLMLSDIKHTCKPVLRNPSASLWDIGDGVCCFEFTSKMNSIDLNTLQLLQKAIETVSKDYKALVIYSDQKNFSAGANLGLALFAVNIAAWDSIEQLVDLGQQTYHNLKYSPFPVVGAPCGIALGGGCEILLHCDAIQAHIETYTGLVEVGVGLVPAWGGCKEMLSRWSNQKFLPNGPIPSSAKVLELISTACVSTSAEEAQKMAILRPDDSITMNRYRLLSDAKHKALSLIDNYTPPTPQEYQLSGPSGKTAFSMLVQSYVDNAKATKHDQYITLEVAEILTGGALADPSMRLTEPQILALEKQSFMIVVKHPMSLERVEHMLLTGKPLRN